MLWRKDLLEGWIPLCQAHGSLLCHHVNLQHPVGIPWHGQVLSGEEIYYLNPFEILIVILNFQGQTGTAVGKLLTLGGVGIWWIVDIVLLVTNNLLPEDGSNWVPTV